MNSSNVQLFSEVWGFFRNPDTRAEGSWSVALVFKRILILISWLYVLVFPLAILITVLLKLLNYSGVNAVNQFAMSGNLFTIIILGAVIAPLIEELTFRLPLRFSRLNVALAVFFTLRIILAYFARQFWPTVPNVTVYSWTLPVLIAGILYTYLRSPKLQAQLTAWHLAHFSKIFYGLTILFGLLHITNYSEVQNILLIVVLLGIPQILVGMVLGFIRIRYGFIYGVIMHGLYNVFLLIPATLVREPQNTANLTIAGIFGIFVLGLFIYGFSSLLYCAAKYFRA